jgi:hypothetical protein
MLWIDRGAGREGENESIFSALEGQREAIEGRFGAELHWDRSESRRALWVASDSIEGGYQDPEEAWPFGAALLAAPTDRARAAAGALSEAFRGDVEILSLVTGGEEHLTGFQGACQALAMPCLTRHLARPAQS